MLQLSLTHYIRELRDEGVTVLQEEENQETLLHGKKTRFLLWFLVIFLFYLVHNSTAIHKICRGKNAEVKNIWTGQAGDLIVKVHTI